VSSRWYAVCASNGPFLLTPYEKSYRDSHWIEYNDRCLYTQTNTATTYKGSRILSKFYILTCFVVTVKTVGRTHNIAMMY